MATIKQTIAVRKVLEGKIVTQAMREAHYAPSTVNTAKVTKTQGWEELMKKHIGDKKLADLHKKILEKKESIVVRVGKESHIELTEQPHPDAVKGLDMAYKLKGHYAAEKTVSLNINANPEDLKKHKALRDEYEEKLLNQLRNDEH